MTHKPKLEAPVDIAALKGQFDAWWISDQGSEDYEDFSLDELARIAGIAKRAYVAGLPALLAERERANELDLTTNETTHYGGEGERIANVYRECAEELLAALAAPTDAPKPSEPGVAERSKP